MVGFGSMGGGLWWVVFSVVCARITTLHVEGDSRVSFHLDTFGFEPNGRIDIQFDTFTLKADNRASLNDKAGAKVAFVLKRSESGGEVNVNDKTCMLLKQNMVMKLDKPADW